MSSSSRWLTADDLTPGAISGRSSYQLQQASSEERAELAVVECSLALRAAKARREIASWSTDLQQLLESAGIV